MQPDNKYPYYRLARSYARLGANEEALTNLKLAVEHGMKNLDLLNKEISFQSLHGHKAYQDLLETMK